MVSCHDDCGIRCINQLIRPKVQIPKWMWWDDGIGDCSTCKPCPQNLKCKGYTPVSLMGVEVQTSKDEKKA